MTFREKLNSSSHDIIKGHDLIFSQCVSFISSLYYVLLDNTETENDTIQNIFTSSIQILK